MTWLKADYWAVFPSETSDEILFRGSKTACKTYARKHGGVVAHVISENV